MHEIVVHAGEPTGVIDHVLEHDLVMLSSMVSIATRAIHRNSLVHAPEFLVRMKLHCEADTAAVVAAAFTALEMEGHVVEGLLLIVDHCRPKGVIAHHIG